MYIHELLNNPEFNFNAPVRILKYLGGDETVTVFLGNRVRRLTRKKRRRKYTFT